VIAAVTSRVVHHDAYPEVRDAVSQEWSSRLARWDLLTVHVPNVVDDADRWLTGTGTALLVLSGGDDVGPVVTDGLPRHGAATALDERDRTEVALFEAAVRSGLPVLAVCRGAQLVNWRLGGRTTRVDDGWHVATTHEVTVVADGAGLRRGQRLAVNSFHDNVIGPDDLAPPLRATAVADDGTVEAFILPGQRLVGIQWHPERPMPAPDGDDAIVAALLAR
jgi:gamma-glutamyl-gamma-aminobutyrate hydrolase PuuD